VPRGAAVQCNCIGLWQRILCESDAARRHASPERTVTHRIRCERTYTFMCR